jgi:hypothetical protein
MNLLESALAAPGLAAAASAIIVVSLTLGLTLITVGLLAVRGFTLAIKSARAAARRHSQHPEEDQAAVLLSVLAVGRVRPQRQHRPGQDRRRLRRAA